MGPELANSSNLEVTSSWLVTSRESRRVAALGNNLLASFCRIFLIHIQNTDRQAIRRESQGDGSSNAATATGYDGDFAVKSETLRLGILICQRETPLFHGMKSSCPFSSALVRTSPFATLIT